MCCVTTPKCSSRSWSAHRSTRDRVERLLMPMLQTGDVSIDVIAGTSGSVGKRCFDGCERRA